MSCMCARLPPAFEYCHEYVRRCIFAPSNDNWRIIALLMNFRDYSLIFGKTFRAAAMCAKCFAVSYGLWPISIVTSQFERAPKRASLRQQVTRSTTVAHRTNEQYLVLSSDVCHENRQFGRDGTCDIYAIFVCKSVNNIYKYDQRVYREGPKRVTGGLLPPRVEGGGGSRVGQRVMGGGKPQL